MPQTINNMVQEWTNALTTYTAIKMNIPTDVSAAGSLLMDLQVGGSSKFKVGKDGVLTAPWGTISTSAAGGISLLGVLNSEVWLSNVLATKFPGSSPLAVLAATAQFGFGNGGLANGLNPDTILTRRAAANLRLGAADAAAPVAQTLSVQSVVAGTTNANGADLTITGSQSTGSGTAGAIVLQTASAGTSGTSQNALATVATFGPNTLTGSQTTPVLALAQTWNTTGVAVGIRLNITNTASDGGSRWLDFQIGGNSRFIVGRGNQANGYIIQSDAGGEILNNNSLGLQLKWGAGTNLTIDSVGVRVGGTLGNAGYLAADAANILALRNGANAQTFRVYNTTDGTNSEFGVFSWFGNDLYIGTQKTGTGATRAIRFTQGSGATIWQINTSGHFLAETDNTYDIGASGASRPRNVFVAGKVELDRANSEVNGPYVGIRRNTNGGLIRCYLSADAAIDGNLVLTNSSLTDFGRLQFGGTTSSFPALKRNSTALETKLADDSAYAPHAMQYLDVTDGITAPASATGRARIYVDTADGDLKVIFADGTVKTIVTDT